MRHSARALAVSILLVSLSPSAASAQAWDSVTYDDDNFAGGNFDQQTPVLDRRRGRPIALQIQD